MPRGEGREENAARRRLFCGASRARGIQIKVLVSIIADIDDRKAFRMLLATFNPFKEAHDKRTTCTANALKLVQRPARCRTRL